MLVADLFSGRCAAPALAGFRSSTGDCCAPSSATCWLCLEYTASPVYAKDPRSTMSRVESTKNSCSCLQRPTIRYDSSRRKHEIQLQLRDLWLIKGVGHQAVPRHRLGLRVELAELEPSRQRGCHSAAPLSIGTEERGFQQINSLADGYWNRPLSTLAAAASSCDRSTCPTRHEVMRATSRER